MFSLGVMMVMLGYAMAYTGAANIRYGYQGPTLSQSVGFSTVLAPPSPVMTGKLAGTPDADKKNVIYT